MSELSKAVVGAVVPEMKAAPALPKAVRVHVPGVPAKAADVIARRGGIVTRLISR